MSPIFVHITHPSDQESKKKHGIYWSQAGINFHILLTQQIHGLMDPRESNGPPPPAPHACIHTFIDKVCPMCVNIDLPPCSFALPTAEWLSGNTEQGREKKKAMRCGRKVAVHIMRFGEVWTCVVSRRRRNVYTKLPLRRGQVSGDGVCFWRRKLYVRRRVYRAESSERPVTLFFFLGASGGGESSAAAAVEAVGKGK